MTKVAETRGSGVAAVALGQLMVVQLVALVGLAAWPHGWALRGPWLALAPVVSAVTLLRWRGRWLFTWVEVALRFWRRSDRVAERPGALVDPSATQTFEAFTDRSGTSWGFLTDSRGWSVVLAAESLDLAVVSTPELPKLSVQTIIDGLGGHDVRLAAVQILTRVTPAPSPLVDPRSPVATSYAEASGGQAVAHQSTWVTLRLDPALCPAAVAARGGGAPGAQRALAALAARLVAAVAPVVRLRPLGPDDVRTAYAVALGGNGDIREESWSGVTTHDAVHTGQAILSLGQLDESRLVRELSRVPFLAAAVATTLYPGVAGYVSGRSVLRTAALPADLEKLEVVLKDLTDSFGVRLRRLDGEHGLALAETVALGGTRWSSCGRVAEERLLPPETLSLRGISVERGGLVLGRDNAGVPVSLALMRERPIAISAVLDTRLALVLCFRALATGARIQVVTGRPNVWLALRRLGIDDPQIIEITSPETANASSSFATSPSPGRPLLTVIDQASLDEPARMVVAPWQCQLTLLPDLSIRALPAARSASAVLLQRLGRVDAVAAGPFLGLAAGRGQELTQLADEQLAIVERGALRVIELGLTKAESQLVVVATGLGDRSTA